MQVFCNFYFMSQQLQKPHIEEVIQCLIQQQKSLTLASDAPQDISNLYQSTKALLAQFQDHIVRCKKYNQAKIHRKYQILINQLSEENAILRSKISEQLQARPSSQRYVSDLIDKMIEIRNQNKKLMRENQTLQNMLHSYEQKAQLIANGQIEKNQNQLQRKEILRQQIERSTLKQSLSQFLANKQAEIKNLQARQKSNFQRFLQANKGKVQKWSLLDFFQKIDKWTLNLKDVRFPDRSKIKSSFEHSFEKIRDSSLSPITDRLPNTLNSLKNTKQTKSYLQGSFLIRNRLFERIIPKNKKLTSFRLKSLVREETKAQTNTIQ